MATTAGTHPGTLVRPAFQSTWNTPFRALVHRRGRITIRRHLVRGVARVTALLAVDLGAFIVARGAIRMVREGELLGQGFANFVRGIVPQGYLGGWQFASALLIGLVVMGTYGRGDRRRDAGRIFAGVSLGAGLSLWDSIWWVGPGTVVLQFAGTVLAVSVALIVGRSLVDWAITVFVPSAWRAERVVFVGDPTDREATSVAGRLVRGDLMTSVGWVHDTGEVEPRSSLGTTLDIWAVLEAAAPDTIVLCGDLTPKAFEDVVEAASAGGCRVLSISPKGTTGRYRPRLVWQRDMPLIELTVPALKGQQLLIKRVIDLMGSTAGLVVLSPVFAVMAVLIKLDSPGPVFFSQERVGFGGRVFRMLKFRTMWDGADAEKHAVAHLNHTGDPRLFKIPNDPRVTRLGRWLRKWSLDELPQLLNVFLGHMSLVGPRPFFEADMAAYADHHFSRLGAKPGITGLWQVKGRSEVIDFEEVVRLDREYIDRWSLILDLRILWQTLPAVVRRTGAY